MRRVGGKRIKNLNNLQKNSFDMRNSVTFHLPRDIGDADTVSYYNPCVTSYFSHRLNGTVVTGIVSQPQLSVLGKHSFCHFHIPARFSVVKLSFTDPTIYRTAFYGARWMGASVTCTRKMASVARRPDTFITNPTGNHTGTVGFDILNVTDNNLNDTWNDTSYSLAGHFPPWIR